MKFVVTKHGLGETDVRLHWETKYKIKKILGTAGWIAGCSVIVLSLTKKRPKK